MFTERLSTDDFTFIQNSGTQDKLRNCRAKERKNENRIKPDRGFSFAIKYMIEATGKI